MLAPKVMRAAPLAITFALGCGPAPYVIVDEPSPAAPVAVAIEPAARTAPEAPDRWLPGDPQPIPFDDGERWFGDYDCPQGRTDLELSIIDVRGALVRAVFMFRHEPTRAAGSYTMTGRIDELTGVVNLEPSMWIERPEGYESVGLVGKVSKNGRRFVGRVNHPACGAFRLRRGR